MLIYDYMKPFYGSKCQFLCVSYCASKRKCFLEFLLGLVLCIASFIFNCKILSLFLSGSKKKVHMLPALSFAATKYA